MKKAAVKRLILILIALAAVIVLGYFGIFYRADEITVTDGKIAGMKSTWLVAKIAREDGERYYKLGDVTAPREFGALKDAPDPDGDPLTGFFAFEGKAGTDVEGLTVTVEGCDRVTGSDTAVADRTGSFFRREGEALVFDMDSPYPEKVIRVTVTCPEGEEKRAEAALEAVVKKITPGKKLSGVAADFKLNFIDDDRWMYLWSGLLTTLEITLFAVLMGIVIGVVVAVVRATWDQNRDAMHNRAAKWALKAANSLCQVYLTVIRGTPVVIQLMIAYYIIFVSSRNGVMVAVISFGINSGAYVAEIIRGGLMSVDRGQMEAGRSLGFNYVETMAYIIVPQAFKAVLPALANEFIVLLKETSVAGYVAVRDLTKGGDIIRGVTYSAFMPLIAVAVIYLILVMFFTWLVGKLERRLRSSDH